MAEPLADLFKYFDCGRDDLGTDAIAGKQNDIESHFD